MIGKTETCGFGNPRSSTGRRNRNQTECRAAALRAPSPLNGERAGVRGGKVVALRKPGELRPHLPSPSFPLPVEGRGRPLAQALENLRGLRRFRAILIDLEVCATGLRLCSAATWLRLTRPERWFATTLTSRSTLPRGPFLSQLFHQRFQRQRIDHVRFFQPAF